MQIGPPWYSALPQSIAANLIAAGIWLILGLFFICFRTRLPRMRRAVRPILLGVMGLFYVFANLLNYAQSMNEVITLLLAG